MWMKMDRHQLSTVQYAQVLLSWHWLENRSE